MNLLANYADLKGRKTAILPTWMKGSNNPCLTNKPTAIENAETQGRFKCPQEVFVV